MSDMALHDIGKICNRISRDNGFDPALQSDFTADPNKVLAKIALMHTELAEATEAVRHADWSNFCEEMADVVIRVLETCYSMAVDIDEAVMERMMANMNEMMANRGKLVVRHPSPHDSPSRG